MVVNADGSVMLVSPVAAAESLLADTYQAIRKCNCSYPCHIPESGSRYSCNRETA